jgi:hypothetical protein
MCAVEFLLINQHKPILNEQDMLSQDCTVNLHMKWDYLSPFGELDVDALEHELAMTHRNILSNQTRIAAYQQEAKALEELMRDIRPFYEYLNANIQNLANNPGGLFEIPDGMILPGAGVYIGESYIDHWCDERVAKDSKTFIEFSGELLLALFAATKYDDWIAKTIYEVGEKQCRLILEKATNLERRNEALNAKMDVLQKHLGA